MTPDELNERTATFDTRAAAQAAADALLPRRTRHNRPYAQASGFHSARTGHDTWIVIVGNCVLLTNGFMFDHVREVMFR